MPGQAPGLSETQTQVWDGPPYKWDPGGVSHHSYVRIGSASLFYARDWYDRDIAALSSEADRYFESGKDDEGDSYGYQTTARRMRERLQARGFSAQRAWSGLASAVARWAKEPADGRPSGSVEDEFQRYARQLEDVELVSIEDFEAAHDQPLPTLKNYPTLGPYSPNPVLTDINRSAGALEMYLGRDVLTSMANSYRSSGGTTTPSSGGTRAHSWTRTRRPSRRRSRRRSSRRSPAAAPQRRKTGAG